MRRALALCGLAFVLIPAATAAAPAVTVTTSHAVGLAPLAVTLTASGAAATYAWDFGDGTTGAGNPVTHTYAAGAWTATATATNAAGESTQAAVSVTAYTVGVGSPLRVQWRQRLTLRGTTNPALPRARVVVLRDGVAVGHGVTTARGTYSVRARATVGGNWAVQIGALPPVAADVRVVPRLTTRVVGSGLVRKPLALLVRVRPAGAGTLAIRAARGSTTLLDEHLAASSARVRLPTNRRGVVVARVSVEPSAGYASATHVVRAAIGFPRLRYGSAGAAVHELTSRLAALHYAAPRTSRFDSRVLDGVYAFEKVQGLPRTGVVDTRFWQRLASPRIPTLRYRSPAQHVEVDKRHQVLYEARGGRIVLIVPVSTAGLPGKFTPVGAFSVYRKVDGFDPSPLGTLYDPMYFTGGYAIHGNPSVPPYPASHGCVRVPMWVAPHLYASVPYGERVFVY